MEQGGEKKISKSEMKRRRKAEMKAKKMAEKKAAREKREAEQAAKRGTKKKLVADADVDPSKYFDNRVAAMKALEASGTEIYPHKVSDYYVCSRFLSRLCVHRKRRAQG